MNLVTQTIWDRWHLARVSHPPSGWISRNAPCCEHRGQTKDTRGRCGLKIFDGESVTIKCFNCGFSANFTPGKPIYPKFLKLLSWLGIDDDVISQLKLESLKLSELTGSETTINVRKIKSIELPSDTTLLTNIKQYEDHIKYIESRGINYNEFPLLVSSSIQYRRRVIIPFIYQDTIIGYSARSINPNEKNRFIMKQTMPFVYGLNFIKPEYEWVILSEGLFDAMCIKGLAVCHNEISDEQIDLINDLDKRIIVVPDLDKSGLSMSEHSLLNTAIDNDWNVSFPEWDSKDINDAYVRYGSLFVIKHILNNVIDNSLLIKIKQKLYLNKIREKKLNGNDQK
jgi:hypothetical protein